VSFLRVFIGYDPREAEAYRVAEASLRRRASIPVDVTPLRADQLRMQGLLRRLVDNRGGMFDLASQAAQSTEFAVSRFLTPILAQSGWALFVDCDVVFLGDVAELLELADPNFAVQVVKHNYLPKEQTKMAGAVQTTYPQKNRSSVMLFHANHPSKQRLTIDAINNWPGRELHSFKWLHPNEIGELPPAWNWLVNVTEAPSDPRLAHFTLGGPWIQNWQCSEHDEIWLDEARR
jgi:lipopolysaccharide biosynthesis glycosyltransferase